MTAIHYTVKAPADGASHFRVISRWPFGYLSSIPWRLYATAQADATKERAKGAEVEVRAYYCDRSVKTISSAEVVK